MKRTFTTILSLGAMLVMVPMLAAYEAHVLNVIAQIENGGDIIVTPGDPVDFGTVFPQEKLDKQFEIALSQTFINDPQYDLLEYSVTQEPKCWNGNEQAPVFGEAQIVNNQFVCIDQGFTFLPILCPYLSKHELTGDATGDTEPGETPGDPVDENDGPGILAFHGVIDVNAWSPLVASSTMEVGALKKTAEDLADTWNIDLKVPCFTGHCAQDWEDYVKGINPQANPDDYIQPLENEHKLFGCNIRISVTGKPSTVGCQGKVDLMLVLDRSGSIDFTELGQLKTAANAFVDALAPSASSVHIGQSSFATTGSLDLHLTDNATSTHAAINALIAVGQTNLKSGIDFAKTELNNPGDGHDRTDGDSPDKMVIITDGAPNRPIPAITADDVAAASADAARAAGIEIFALGVGVSASTETFLKTEIADDAAHYYSVLNYADLQAALELLAECD
ncbi:MAG: vWA domain-containing protein [Patescibacteria group bacterium]